MSTPAAEAATRKPTLLLGAAEAEIQHRLLESYAANSERDARKAEAEGNGELAASYLQAAEDWRFRASCLHMLLGTIGLVIKHEAKAREFFRSREAAARKAAPGPQGGA